MDPSISFLRVAFTQIVLLLHSVFIFEKGWDPLYRPSFLGSNNEKLFGIFSRCVSPLCMGSFFFMSGMFVPSSFQKRGLLNFVFFRLIRFGIPILLWMYIFGPISILLIFNIEYTVRTKEHLWFLLNLIYFHGVFVLFALVFNCFEKSPISNLRFNQIFRFFLACCIPLWILTFIARIWFKVTFHHEYFSEVAYLPWYFFAFFCGIFSSKFQFLQCISRAVALFFFILGVVVFSFKETLIEYVLSAQEGLTLSNLFNSLLEIIYLQSMGIGIFGMTYSSNLSNSFDKLANASYAVYFMHPIFLFAIGKYLIYPTREIILASFTFILVSFCWFVGLLVKKIPHSEYFI